MERNCAKPRLQEGTSLIDENALQLMTRNRVYVLSHFFPNGRGFDDRHNFRVSSKSLGIEVDEERELVEIALLIPAYVDGLGKIIALSMIDDKLRRTDPTFKALRHALGLETEYGRMLVDPARDHNHRLNEQDVEAESAALAAQISHEHPLTRLDLVKDARTGRFHIVEIEVDKFHGFGYATLVRDFAENPLGKGLVHQVAEMSRDFKTGMLLSGHERFYLPEARFFAERVRSEGGDLMLVSQNGNEYDSYFQVDESGVWAKGRSSEYLQQLLAVPRFLGSKSDVEEIDARIAQAQSRGQVRVLSRRVPSLGEKAALGIICNPANNENLEVILNACFDAGVLAKLRHFIPTTEFLGFASRQRLSEVEAIIRARSEDYFLKVINESGARGIGSPGDIDAQLDLLRSRPKHTIIQSAIKPSFVRLPFMDVKSGETGCDDFSVRYGLFVSQGQVLDLALTASPGLVAHGGTHSIQLSATRI